VPEPHFPRHLPPWQRSQSTFRTQAAGGEGGEDCRHFGSPHKAGRASREGVRGTAAPASRL
jgi:hypothetical protein